MRAAAVAGLVLVSAAALAAEGDPRIMHVGMVAPDIVCVEIRAGRSEHGRQVPYEARPGDKVERRKKDRWVVRDGSFLGSLVGRDEKLLYTADRLVGAKLDTGAADRPGSWRLTGPDGDVPVTAVYRKTKPDDYLRVHVWRFEHPTRTWVYLKCARRLQQNAAYEVRFSGSGGLAGRLL